MTGLRLKPAVWLATMLLLTGSTSCEGEQEQGMSRDQAFETLAFYQQELQVVDLVLTISRMYKPCECVFRHVNVVDVAAGAVLSDMRVVVRNGLIEQVVPDRSGDDTGLRTIDGTGLYLMPGLADMHVHQLTSASQHLLHVATGVTTVRDMVGFPWLLRWRAMSDSDQWLAPNMIVAGPIISTSPMGMYAQVVDSEAAARRRVREHAAAGYDYIKVHNALEPGVYRAVLDEAMAAGIGVVGHVPHDISVVEALERGQQTIEHLKGYIDDRTLTISSDGWIRPTARASTWLTPTLYSTRMFMRGDSAIAWLNSPEAQYVPALTRRRWREEATWTVPAVAQELPRRQREVLERLIPVTNRFLAGTDAGGGYPFMVAGFGLHEELELLAAAGLDHVEVLRAATVYAAEATGRVDEFGHVRPGQRADLLLVGRDPLEALGALADRQGVMVRGRWLDRAALNTMLVSLETIYERIPSIARHPSEFTDVWRQNFLASIARLENRGYTFPQHHLEQIQKALEVAVGSSSEAGAPQ